MHQQGTRQGCKITTITRQIEFKKKKYVFIIIQSLKISVVKNKMAILICDVTTANRSYILMTVLLKRDRALTHCLNFSVVNCDIEKQNSDLFIANKNISSEILLLGVI